MPDTTNSASTDGGGLVVQAGRDALVHTGSGDVAHTITVHHHHAPAQPGDNGVDTTPDTD
jgi:hypothetical protein